MKLYIIAAAVLVALVLVGMNKSAIIYGSSDANGLMTITSLGNGDYRADLSSLSDNGRAINFYFNHAATANLKTDSSANTALPNFEVSNFTVKNDQMFLTSNSGCIKAPVGVDSPVIMKGYNSDGSFYYALGIVRNFGSPFCGLPSAQCQPDCDKNIPSSTSGYILFHDNAYQSPTKSPGLLSAPANSTLSGTPSGPSNLLGVLVQWLIDGFNVLLKLIGVVN